MSENETERDKKRREREREREREQKGGVTSMANMKVVSLGSAARRNRQDSEVKDRKRRGTFRNQRE